MNKVGRYSNTSFGWTLRSGYYNAVNDTRLFTLWENGSLTTDELIGKFAINNHCTDAYIDKGDFIKWLSTLGWKKLK